MIYIGYREFSSQILKGVHSDTEELPKTVPSPAKSFIEKASIFLTDRFWDNASEYCEKTLDIEPSNAEVIL